MAFTLTFTDARGVYAPTFQNIDSPDPVASGSSILSGATDTEHMRALVDNDRLIWATRLRSVLSVYGSAGQQPNSAGVISTTSASYIPVATATHRTSVGATGEYVALYILSSSGGTADMQLSITNGSSTDTTSVTTSGSATTFVHWNPSVYTPAANSDQEITVSLRDTGGGTATLTAVRIYERALESGDL